MCRNEGVDISCEGTIYTVFSADKLKAQLVKMQNRKRVLPVEITNGAKVLKMFVGVDRIGGWEKNGGEHETPDYIRGIDGVVDFFKLSLAS